MYCSNCGKKVEPGERFCSGCGKPVEEAEIRKKLFSPKALKSIVIIVVVLVAIIALVAVILGKRTTGAYSSPEAVTEVTDEPEEEAADVMGDFLNEMLEVKIPKENLPGGGVQKQNFLANINNPIFIVVFFLLVIICLLWLIYSRKDKK